MVLPILRLIFPRHQASGAAPKKILVSELWHIGDVIIAMPFLAALRERFPDAHITLLSKSHAQATLANSDLVDQVMVADLPWTFLEEDRRPRAWGLGAIFPLVRRLRAEGFDLAFDCSRDGRNHLLMFLSGATRTIGFAYGGGAALLTDPVPVGSLDAHRTDDWLRLLEPFGAPRAVPPARLEPTAAERQWADEFLRERGYTPGDPIVAVHPGGSSRLKRWPVASFLALAETAADEMDARILLVVDPAGTGRNAPLPDGSLTAEPRTLRQLIALLSRCDLLICNDGGPMHLAAALGVPTFAVYSWGKPEWWKPVGTGPHAWINRTDITCRPCAGHCIFHEPICLTGLTVDTAREALTRFLGTLRPSLPLRVPM